MKTFEELCTIVKRITDAPHKKVDYLTIGDFYQLKNHIVYCPTCNSLIDKTPEKAPKTKEEFFNEN